MEYLLFCQNILFVFILLFYMTVFVEWVCNERCGHGHSLQESKFVYF